MKSIRSRLLVISLLAFLGFWGLWVIAWYAYLTSERVGLWDSALQANAQSILEFMPQNEKLMRIAPVTGLPAHRFMRDDLSYQVWSHDTLLVASPGAPRTKLKADGVDGFAEPTFDGEPWRVVAVSDPARGIQVQAGKPRSHQRQIVLWLAATTFVTASLLAAVLVAVIAWGVRWSLRPLASVRSVLHERHAFDLTPLDNAALPREVAPLVESFNAVLSRLSGAIDRERRFVADASHELRTPLAALMAQAHVAQHASTTEERDAALNALSTGIARATRMTEQLLAMARVDSDVGERKRVDLGDVVRVASRAFEHRPQHQTYVLKPAPLDGVADALEILVRNLLDNATRHVPSTGNVDVRCEAVAGKAVLEIRDDGPGVPPEARERLFDRFYRAPGTAGSGSGLGLSLVQRIAQAHDATVELGESPGFCVRVVFPLGRAEG